MIARFLLLASVASASFITPAAHAQDATPQPVDPAAETQNPRGDVIVVTARRRQETAQQVPLAISVVQIGRAHV